MDAGTDPDDLLTAEEVAGMLRMKRAWVYAETRRGSLPHVRRGRYVRYRRSAVTAWIESIEQGARTERHTPSRRVA
ncbi:MAG TPA: helix-turn-helix domain-containing protein [Solirubrobacteraceae bacterium]|nr:helix-turn-helix domain-containing protein [Solirubrobacteraceae bacterium]